MPLKTCDVLISIDRVIQTTRRTMMQFLLSDSVFNSLRSKSEHFGFVDSLVAIFDGALPKLSYLV